MKKKAWKVVLAVILFLAPLMWLPFILNEKFEWTRLRIIVAIISALSCWAMGFMMILIKLYDDRFDRGRKEREELLRRWQRNDY